MGDYQRNRERKPARKFSGGFGADKSRGRFGRDSEESFGDRSRGRFKRDSGRSNRQPLEMHKAVCDKCGKECEVPFKPTSAKPVFCSDCFRKNDDSGSERKERPNTSEDFAKLNQKLDKIMKALKIE